MPPTVFARALTLACRAALLLGLLPALSGCGGGPVLPAFAPACPQPGVLSDAADLSRFDG